MGMACCPSLFLGEQEGTDTGVACDVFVKGMSLSFYTWEKKKKKEENLHT